MPASNLGAGRKDIFDAALPLLHMKLEHAVLCCYIIDLLDIDLAQVLNVYRPTLQQKHRPSVLQLKNVDSEDVCNFEDLLNAVKD